MRRSTPDRPPAFVPLPPEYPPVRQFVRVPEAGKLAQGYVQQNASNQIGALAMRDREPCWIFEPNNIVMQPGRYKSRLVGSFLGLPLYAVSLACCITPSFVSSSSSSVSESSGSFVSSLSSFSPGSVLSSSLSLSSSSVSSVSSAPSVSSPSSLSSVSAESLASSESPGSISSGVSGDSSFSGVSLESLSSSASSESAESLSSSVSAVSPASSESPASSPSRESSLESSAASLASPGASSSSSRAGESSLSSSSSGSCVPLYPCICTGPNQPPNPIAFTFEASDFGGDCFGYNGSYRLERTDPCTFEGTSGSGVPAKLTIYNICPEPQPGVDCFNVYVLIIDGYTMWVGFGRSDLANDCCEDPILTDIRSGIGDPYCPLPGEPYHICDSYPGHIALHPICPGGSSSSVSSQSSVSSPTSPSSAAALSSSSSSQETVLVPCCPGRPIRTALFLTFYNGTGGVPGFPDCSCLNGLTIVVFYNTSLVGTWETNYVAIGCGPLLSHVSFTCTPGPVPNFALVLDLGCTGSQIVLPIVNCVDFRVTFQAVSMSAITCCGGTVDIDVYE